VLVDGGRSHITVGTGIYASNTAVNGRKMIKILRLLFVLVHRMIVDSRFPYTYIYIYIHYTDPEKRRLRTAIRLRPRSVPKINRRQTFVVFTLLHPVDHVPGIRPYVSNIFLDTRSNTAVSIDTHMYGID